MLIRPMAVIVASATLSACTQQRTAATRADNTDAAPTATHSGSASAPVPITFGESFTIDSRIMAEPRVINVLPPSVYGEKVPGPLPVLYMLDGGMNEDFLHIAGLVQILISNNGMRPFILVGIQNTQRRRDLTGPTTSDEDRKIAPVVGGSATFRRFLREELMPTIRARYSTTGETAIVGESLAGLFVVETFFLEPDLFDTYIAADPSVWWNKEDLLTSAGDRLKTPPAGRKTIFIVGSSDAIELTNRLAAVFEAHRTSTIDFHYAPLASETHATIYHPAALQVFRAVFAPPPEPPAK